MVLRRENYQVKTVENDATGLLEVNSFCPGLAILDLMLPDYFGYDLCKENVERSSIPIIMLSANNEINY